MTSLIFGTIYLGHKGFTEHRREKQRVKNYERWEGLRDEYDEQRRIGRESRSLDIQRTGAWGGDDNSTNNGSITNGFGYGENDRPILTLRDQQEANDARTSWRPQECWDGPRTQMQAQMTGQQQQQQQQQQQHLPPQQNLQRHASIATTAPSGYVSPAPQQQDTGAPLLPVRSQKTGATWDEGMPQPLRVTRQSFDDYDHRSAMLHEGRTASVPGRQPQTEQRRSSGEFDRRPSAAYTPSGLRESTTNSLANSRTSTPLPQQQQQQQSIVTEVQDFNFPARYQQQQGGNFMKQPLFNAEPMESHVPGGRMAELIERGF